MSDQAQPLRDFVAQQNAERLTAQELLDVISGRNSLDAGRYLALPEDQQRAISDAEFNRKTEPDLVQGLVNEYWAKQDSAYGEYLKKLSRVANIAETETVLRRAMEPDWKGLWAALKEEARFDATHYDLDMVEHGEDRGKIYKTDDSIHAQALLDRMEQAEALARFKGGV